MKPFMIYLNVNGEEKEFIQFHQDHGMAWKSGEAILKSEYPGQQGEVIRARLLSGLEREVLACGIDLRGKTNDELLAARAEYLKWLNRVKTRAELNGEFLRAKSFEKRVMYAEAILLDFADNTIARDPDEIPAFVIICERISYVCSTEGKNAIYRTRQGVVEFGKVIRDEGGYYWNGNYGLVQVVEPIFS